MDLKMFLLTASSVLLLTSCGKYCSKGSNTVIQFGQECRYKLISGKGSADSLKDEKTNKIITDKVYVHELRDDGVYMIGRNEYLFFNDKTDQIERNIDKHSLPLEKKKVFERLERLKRRLLFKMGK